LLDFALSAVADFRPCPTCLEWLGCVYSGNRSSGFKFFNFFLKEMIMKTILAFSAALCLGLSAPAFASGSSGTSAPAASPDAAKADVKAMKKQADGEYKAAKERCKPMKGDEQKACEKDAKAAHEKAQADIKRAEASAKAAKKSS
jgi:hypothetical protein